MIHALHSNFAMDSLEIWNVMLIFRIKTGGWGNVSRKIKGIFSSWVRFLHVKVKTEEMAFLTIIQMVLLFNEE